jgi:hypothetical protein
MSIRVPSVIDCYYQTCATLAETLVTSLRIVIDPPRPPRPPPFTCPSGSSMTEPLQELQRLC